MDIDSNLNRKGRTLVFGDAHGGFKAFLQVLERCNFNNKIDKLIGLGDVADGWGETAELVEYLIALQEGSNNRHIFLRGNHDAWCQEWLNFGIAKDIWVVQGGKATIDSYIRTGLLADKRHKEFFNKLHNYYLDEQNRGFVHGGFRSKNGLGHEAYNSDYYWDRTLWELVLALHNNYKAISRLKELDQEDGFDEFFRPINYRFEKHKEIYIGHTATTNWINKPHLPEFKHQKDSGPIKVPMHRCNVWNMDTGAGFNGRLSIMDIDTKELFQSDSVKALYPKEHGRG